MPDPRVNTREMIYEDPLTKERPEGVATIIEVRPFPGGEFRCQVVFDGETEPYNRVIYR